MKRTSQFFCTIFLVLVCTFLNAQELDYPSAKEKVYLHTNHTFFKPGETVYFKAYVVRASDQKPTSLSSLLYVEVLNPSGNVMQKLSCKVENGYATGSYDFNDATPGGIYKLRAYTTWMKNENDSGFLVKELTVQKIVTPRVLLKLDFPGKGYGAGDEVKANFSMRNLEDQPIKFYTAKFTVNIGGKAIETNDFKTNHEGKAEIKFKLPPQLKTNDGLLNITVNYDAYTEAISRSIPIVLNKIDLQFLPEGGTFIEGMPTYIAFKALNENGKAADIKGEIRDNDGNTVARFSSYHFGMGKFAFTAQQGKTYSAVITSPANINQTFALPKAAANGVSMNCQRWGSKVFIKLGATESRHVILSGWSKNTRFFAKTVQLQQGINEFELDENLFPIGIAQFTVYTANGLPLAERLVFLNENRDLNITVTTDKKKYQPREKVKLTIKTKNESGQPVPSNLSLSVVDDKLWTFADDKQDHILSWLLLTSELKGKVEEPRFYFKKDEPKAPLALDLVMLTHGYRYFDYIEYVKKEEKLQFTPDQGNILNGVTVDKKGKPIKSRLFLVQAIADGNAISIQTTDEGLFFFSELKSNTTYYLFAQGTNKQPVKINILQNGFGYNVMKSLNLRKPASDSSNIPVYVGQLKAVKKREVLQPVIIAEQNAPVMEGKLSLNEVVVTGFSVNRRSMYAGASTRIDAKDLALTAPMNFDMMLQGRVAGVNVINAGQPGTAQNIRMRGLGSINHNQQPLLVINNVPMTDFDLSTISPEDIESVTVLRDGNATALYGSRAANGAIIVQSKTYKSGKIRINLGSKYNYSSQSVYTSGPVYSVAREFYAPMYHTLETDERSDFRETIYWNPVVQTDRNGTAKIEFYNSDATTTFRLIAEGISYDGKAGRTEATYAAQNAMSVDAKIPPYLTVGDKALLPLVIRNNRNEPISLNISVVVPAEMKTGKFDNTVQLLPDSSGRILIPVEAQAATRGWIQFIVRNGQTKEVLTLPIEAAQKGFPVVETFSGNRSKQFQYAINQLVPGTLKTNLKVYRNIEGQLLDGIESMLREPHGCFEQTSSSTYPNIYVLKYLKESNRSNPEIERKAMDYISRGYQRLLGFETPQHGFEWFGHTPPHEALTAYGLLEFTDMKEFIQVDEQMISRTKAFLLGRRDGKGNFTLAMGGYDRFASVPNKIANVYIVYALTQAGMGKEIELEYKSAVKQALSSKDGYILAMTALSASNMKQQQDYEQLMSALSTLYNGKEISSETSVVCSRGISLQVEAGALYALALMRESTPKTGLIAELISNLLSQKSYYGYGSTQATVLALKAVVEYSKLTGKISNETQMIFTSNNQQVKENRNINLTLQEGRNSFAVSYGDDKKTIPYNFEVAYNTLTPPNSDKAEILLSTRLNTTNTALGETVRMQVEVKNSASRLQPMTVAKLGIPAGLSIQPWQLKELVEKKSVAYYEIFDNYLVLYWMGFAPNEAKTINLDLKADIPGTYKAKASNAYLYYMPEHKNWNDGLEANIRG